MLLEMFLFELAYRLKRVSTYVYFLLFFLISFFSVSVRDFGPIGASKVFLNGPYAQTMYNMQFMMFGVVILSAMFGTAILRDFQENTYQLIFTKPLRKTAYLGGRWLGSLVICLGIFLSIPLGVFLGGLSPNADRDRFLPVMAANYLQPYLVFTATQIFWMGSLFFFVAAMTRRLMVVYLQGVLLLGLYLIVAVYVLSTRSNYDNFWPAVFDPVGMVLSTAITRYWTIDEKNTQLLSWTGMFLYNRLLWMGVGVASLAGVFALFPMSAEALTTRKMRRTLASAEDEMPAVAPMRAKLRSVPQHFGQATTWAQLLSLFRLNLFTILREIPFWAIVLVTFILAFVNGSHAGEWYGTKTWPVTYNMIQAVNANSIFYYVISALYAGELVWKQRDVRFDQIHDAAPAPSWINYVASYAALAVVQAIVLGALIVAGVILQAQAGYYNFELGLYGKETYLLNWPQQLIFAAFALFAHTMLANKFMAHALVIGTMVVLPILYRYGLENRLFLLGDVVPYTYSDMNGYGHYVEPLATLLFYWLMFSGILSVAAVLFLRRGTDLAWASRLKVARGRWGVASGVALLLFTSGFAASGYWYYVNTQVRNELLTADQRREMQAEYERKYRKYFLQPQPKITRADIDVDIYPERRGFSAKGYFALVNDGTTPIREVYLSESQESFRSISFDRPHKLQLADKRLGFYIYTFDKALEPGETARLDFQVGHETKGFRNSGELTAFAYNGTFFDRQYFPRIGYNASAEEQNPARRKELKLGPLHEMPKPDEASMADVNLFTPDSQWISFRTTVSTSPDQIAIAPGYLKREWTANGRRYFEYDMGDTKINHFYAFLSGRYQVLRDQYEGMPIEIYYHPGHEYNLKRMVDGIKKSMAYFQTNFGPYQFKQYRVLEFPRYRSFAQSFPNTVPYSEGLGFIMRFEKPDEDIDQVFYITAHELAHQWWGHRVIGRYAQGSNMMSETLAQYSALMIMEKEYGADSMKRFLRHELDGYLRGRGSETREEPPLTLVQSEPYVWYQKGSLVMYALRDYIGEEALNRALRAFVAEHKFANRNLPNTTAFVAAIKRETPPEMHGVVTDLFERIVLFDNKAVQVKATPAKDGQYKVEIEVSSRKLHAGKNGKETEVALDDFMDIGVFAGTEKKPKMLYLAKHRIQGKTAKFEVMVKEKPTRAGIDPLHKLVDRNPEDNWKALD